MLATYKYYYIGFIILSSFLLQRYINNVNKTSNQIQYLDHIINPHTEINQKLKKYYIFWNGNQQSTYLIITLLLQDYIIQPIYIQEYTIIKGLDIDKIQDLLHSPKNNNQEYLHYLKNLKIKQELDYKKLQELRITITKRYAEFSKNLLSTQYVSSIQKDLQFTQTFSNILNKLQPTHQPHIEFLEQCSRFSKHYKQTILLPCTKNSKIYNNLNSLYHLDNSMFSNLIFPIMNLDKEKIKINALKNKFFDIL